MDSRGSSVAIIIPCFNEEKTLPILFKRLDDLKKSADIPLYERCNYSFLFVDDGSKDGTRDLIRSYASRQKDVQYIFLSRNFGKEPAMLAAFDAVEADAAVIIDADLQDPPALIPSMVALWRQGYDDVYAKRRSRKRESVSKKATSRLLPHSSIDDYGSNSKRYW